MNVRSNKLSPKFWGMLLLCAVVWGANTAAAQTEGATPQPIMPKLVLRIGGDWFAKVAQGTIVEKEPVDEIAFNTRVRGTSKTTAQIRWQVLDHAEAAAMRIGLTGEIVSHTVCWHGPARIYSVRKIPFTAEKLITFGGEQIEHHPAEMTCLGNEVVHQIHTSQGGMRRLVVLRVAEQQLDKLKPEADALAQQNARRRVQGAFDRAAECQVRRLNRGLRLVSTLRRVARPLISEDVQLTTRSDGLQLAIGGQAGWQTVSELPVSSPSHAVELYLQDAVLSKTLRARFERWERWQTWSDLASVGSSSLTVVVAREMLSPVLPHASLQQSGTWWILRLGPAEPLSTITQPPKAS